jgi:hypothetical protein
VGEHFVLKKGSYLVGSHGIKKKKKSLKTNRESFL